MPLLRHEIGDVLRDVRQLQGRTLREVSHDARVSLGYLSEVERGQKEASSELLASICQALDIPLSYLLREVSDRLVEQEGMVVPDTLPDDLKQKLTELMDNYADSSEEAKQVMKDLVGLTDWTAETNEDEIQRYGEIYTRFQSK